MGDAGVTQRRSIINYFQKEKLNDPLTKDKKDDNNPTIVELKDNSLDLGDVNHPIGKKEGDPKVKDCISFIDNEELVNCVLDRGDCQQDRKGVAREGSVVEQEWHRNVNEKCHCERKGKWNFSWKQGKTRKNVKIKTVDTSYSDQDFEVNLKSNSAKSNKKEIIISKSKTREKKESGNRTKTSRYYSKPGIEKMNPSNSEDRLNCLEDISQNTIAVDEDTYISQNTIIKINDKRFESESNRGNLDISDKLNTAQIVKIKDPCKSPEFAKDGLEDSKNYFDILMQSSKQKALEKQKSDVTEGESDNHKGDRDISSSCKEGNRIDELTRRDEKKGKRNKVSRRKKGSSIDEVDKKIDRQNALLKPRKQTRNHRQNRCNADETAVKRSARSQKRSTPSPEDIIEDLNQRDAMDTPDVNEISTKSLTRKRTLKTAKKGIALEATGVISPDNKGQLEERKQDLLEQQEDIESRVGEGTDTCVKATRKKNCEDSISTKPKRGRRLRQSCILDSSDEEEQASELRVETKPSPVKSGDKQPQKVSGPIAPIFLPGAWRRAKAKLQEAEILEAEKEIVEIKEDSSPRAISKATNSPVQNESDTPTVSANVTDESSASLTAFLGIFKKPATKPCPVPMQFIKAPFPKVSHVQQKDEANDMKWNLLMVRNRFVKEEYFFWPDASGFVMERSMSLCFLKTESPCLEKKATLISKSSQLTELDKSQKQDILSYLKTIYEGIPIKKLFKRCHHQLHTCKKLLMENKNVAGRSIKTKESFKQGPLVSSNVTVPSTHVPGKSAPFTKISKKTRATAQRKTKTETIKKKESPLLLAFQNQENTAKNKNVDIVKTRPKKEKGKTSSIVNFMGKQTKQVEDIPTKKQSGELKKGKKTSCQNKIENYVDKKRLRDGEEQDGKPTGKKAKLINDGQEFKKPRKGQKRKVRSVDSKENGKTVEIKDDNSGLLGKSSKCRKISSDDDFIKPSTRRPRLNVDTNNDAADDCGPGKQSLRKSRRLQEKSEAEMKDVLVKTKMTPEVTNNGSTENEIIEVFQGKEDCSKQEDQVQVHENDGKVVEDEPSVVVEETTKQMLEPSSSTEKAVNEESDVSCSAVLWSECFKPRNSTEILGNTNAGGKLRNWLFEWKTLREKKLEALKRREQKKHRRLAAKKRKKETWWQDEDSDSDFYSSDDSNDENFGDEDILCNTMLLSGPVGSGKTSAIYACAEELGFKVIEVNSSTKRGGKYILSELLEATQSHQVSTKRSTQTELFPRANAAPSEDKEKPKEHMKNEKGRPKKKEQLSEETQLQGPMSLILLDEVDILFEEDKGFWVSVNSLRQNSKRPIVMTASELTAIDIDGEYEHIMLKSPSLKLYAAHFQTVCLTKDVFVNPSDLRALSWLHHADIRRLLLNLQFWIDSTAGACVKGGITIRNDIGNSSDILDKNDVESAHSKTTQYGNAENISSEDCEFSNAIEVDSTVGTQRECDVKVPSAGVIVDEGTAGSTSPMEVESGLDMKGCTQNSTNEMVTLEKREKLQPLHENKVDNTEEVDGITEDRDCGQGGNDEPASLGENDTASSQKARIEMHNLCLESMLGIRNIDNHVGNVLEALKSDLNTNKDSFRQKCLVTSHCQGLNMDIVYCNLEEILPCLFSSVNKSRDKPRNPKLRNYNGHSFNTEKNVDSLKDQNNVESFVNIPDGTEDNTTASDKDLLSKKFDGISLTCLGNFYEDMSFMDSELWRDDPGTPEEIFDSWSARISPGLSDTAGKHTAKQIPWKTMNLQNELRGALEVAGLAHSHRKFHNLCSREGEQVMRFANKLMSKPYTAPSSSDQDITSDTKVTESRVLPKFRDEMVANTTNAFNSLDGESCLQVTTLSENLASKTRKRELEFSSISSFLPELNSLNRRSLVMDYRPTLHTICKDESLRKAARIKRRFYHYFDSIGLHISSSVIQSLTDDSYFI